MSSFLKNLTRPDPNAPIPAIGVCDDRKLKLIGRVCAWLIRAYVATLRVRWEGFDDALAAQKDRGLIVSVWHRRLMLAATLGRRFNIASMASRSRDGEIIAQVLTRLGLTMVRGSHFKGAVSSLKAMLSLPRDCVIAITPDGPRGPVFTLQPGILLLAENTGRLILPVSWRASREIRMKSWDSFALPVPFSRAKMRLGKPIDLQALPGDLEEKRMELERRLRAFEEETERCDLS